MFERRPTEATETTDATETHGHVMLQNKKQNMQNVKNNVSRADYLSYCKGSSFKDDREHLKEKGSISDRRTATITYKGIKSLRRCCLKHS